MATKMQQRDRPMSAERWRDLQRLFKVLANETRLRMLHELDAAEELCVGDLADAIGMAPQAVSNQLQRLVDRRIVEARRDGNYVYYRIVDPCVPGLLELGTCLINETAAGTPRR
jgi:ArsR family transcriptional regulator, lead/cadmium/zinc/bismuth-responsive transcriptional repressor